MADSSMDSGHASEEVECMDDDGDDSSSQSDEEETEMAEEEAKAYLPGEPVPEGEELVCDQSAYIMYHEAQTGELQFTLVS